MAIHHPVAAPRPPVRRYCPACGDHLDSPQDPLCRSCRRAGSQGGRVVATIVILFSMGLGAGSALLLMEPPSSPAPSIHADPPGRAQAHLVARLLPAALHESETPVSRALPAVVKKSAYRRVDPNDPRIVGLHLPIANLDGLPKGRDLYPASPRAYRGGWHEGLDFYPEDGWNAVIGWGTPVLAVSDGVVDSATSVSFQEMAPSVHGAVLAQSKSIGFTPMDVLIRLRGRSAWIDHGHGFKSCSAHLSRLADGIVPGARVSKGQVIGYVGNSGTTAGVNQTRGDSHLHLELWLDGRIAGFQWAVEDYRHIWQFKGDKPKASPDQVPMDDVAPLFLPGNKPKATGKKPNLSELGDGPVVVM